MYLVNKYPDNPLLKQTENGYSTYMHRPKVFRIAEIYLIAAEAAYKNGDQTNAKTYLDRLRTARGIGSVTYTDLWAEIQNERNRELAFEGFRMADIKRWNLGVVRGTPQNLNAIVSDPADQYHQLNSTFQQEIIRWFGRFLQVISFMNKAKPIGNKPRLVIS